MKKQSIIISLALILVLALAIPSLAAGQTHTVQPGETLTGIASAYGVSTTALMQANGISNPNLIFVGQSLTIPGGNMPSGGNSGQCSDYHYVVLGDTLSGIAWDYGVSLSALVSANGIQGDIIYEGQKLCIPGSKPQPKPQPMPMNPNQQGPSMQNPNQGMWQNQPQGQPQMQGQQPMPMNPNQTMNQAQTPRPPDYVDPSNPNQGNQTGPPDCYIAMDKNNGSTVQVEALTKWCAEEFSIVADPDGKVSMVIRTPDKPKTPISIKRNGQLILKTETDNEGKLVYPTIPGKFLLWVDDGSEAQLIEFELESGEQAILHLRQKSVSVQPQPRNVRGWSGRIAWNTGGTEPAGTVASVVIIKAGARGLPIKIEAEGGGFEARCFTGSKIEHGDDACEFGGLWPGLYTVSIEGADAAVDVYVDGGGTAMVVFDHQ